MTNTVSSASDSVGKVNRETYLKHLLTQAAAAADESHLGLKALRDRAIALVNERSFPSGKDEEWRFTDLSQMLEQPFQRAQPVSVEADSWSDHLNLLTEGACLTTINGHYEPTLSRKADQTADAVIIGPLSQLLKHPDYAKKLAPILESKLAQVKGGSEVFTALNTVGFADVMVVWVQADQVVDTPIYIARGSQGGFLSQVRSLVIAERHAKFTLVESFFGQDEDTNAQCSVDQDRVDQAKIQDTRCNNSVTEIWLAEGAQINHIRVQDESASTFHLAKTAVDQAANSQYQCTAVDLGAKLSRHHIEVYQSGPQTDTKMYGLSALGDRQLADTHSLLALTYPHGSATQIQKNIVDDRAHCVFNGKVYVSTAAQLTDASQLNRNLMLSTKARVDTKPELDIVADNVKCAHGATVSQLQADEVFYLQSRGISAEQAQRLLLYGFGMEVVEKISVPALKTALSTRLRDWAS
ncbi:Fe-S cluster assembly protein SufD [cf. Phormidesmis sp. LEGE 11477]|uniref:Fe-S cluster assembly protein SufD n=1 Tax=cf. Phormidesmis sp. LEGE 11477 TaxID=1828680 RepID=UPI00187ECE59|nr:Fe-S cluster assembly protein SufD [cf. Phormidesmis sp. LEGE 11477]MBE9062826.1 Fe-S cluster assembly protein SufD [cf. Phormidesmis sp. LEGE 11477]